MYFNKIWANDGIWTRDLFLTKETLYPWATPALKVQSLNSKVNILELWSFKR